MFKQAATGPNFEQKVERVVVMGYRKKPKAVSLELRGEVCVFFLSLL